MSRDGPGLGRAVGTAGWGTGREVGSPDKSLFVAWLPPGGAAGEPPPPPLQSRSAHTAASVVQGRAAPRAGPESGAGPVTQQALRAGLSGMRGPLQGGARGGTSEVRRRPAALGAFSLGK